MMPVWPGDVGAVVTATDADGDTLTYSLEGTDAAKFGIVEDTGQIQTKSTQQYDREVKASYSVTVKAVDGNGGSDTIMVTITVDNGVEKPQQAGYAHGDGDLGEHDEPGRELDGAGQRGAPGDHRLQGAVPGGRERQLDKPCAYGHRDDGDHRPA